MPSGSPSKNNLPSAIHVVITNTTKTDLVHSDSAVYLGLLGESDTSWFHHLQSITSELAADSEDVTKITLRY